MHSPIDAPAAPGGPVGAASYAVDQHCRVDDFINVFKLQSVMNNLVSRLDAQQAHIQRLEDELRHNSLSARQFDAYSSQINERLAKVEQTVAGWTGAWRKIESSAEGIAAQGVALQECLEAVALKTDAAEFVQLKHDVAEAFALHRDEMGKSHASASIVSALEDSQHRLLEEVVAMQQLLACKVDRVEVPLLNVAGDKLRRLVEFQDAAAPRLEQLEEAVVTASRVLAQKEDREAVAQRLQHVHEELQLRPALGWLTDKVVAPVDALQKDVGAMLQTQEAVEAALARVRALSAQVEAMDKAHAIALSAFEKLETKLDTAAEAMRSKPSLESLQGTLDERDRVVEQILQKNLDRAAADAKIQAAYVADVRAQLLEVARQHGGLERKIGVALKFIDWFTDVKLKGGSFDHPLE